MTVVGARTEAGAARPLVTLVILAYNQERFVAEAIRGALAQTWQPLEILVSDDASTDATFEVARSEVATYGGPHQVSLRRNPFNLGFIPHLNALAAAAQGELIVIAAADDVCLPQRVERLAEAWLAAGKPMACLWSNVVTIDAASRRGATLLPPGGASARTAEGIVRDARGIIGCSEACCRRLFEVFGPLPAAAFQEDVALSFRAVMAGGIFYVDEPLVLYRRHPESMTAVPGAPSTGAARAWFRGWARNLIRLNQGFERDLGTAVARGLVTAPRAAHLARLIEGRRREVHAEYLMHGGASALRKLCITARALARGTRWRRAGRWVLMALSMQTYLAVLRRSGGIRSP